MAGHAPHAGGHSHSHSHGHGHGHGGAVGALGVALALTASFMGVEFVAGYLSGSLALIADAWHMLSDSGSLALALVATILARRPRSPRKTYGYRRLEVLAALANGVLLGVAAVLVVIEAVERWQDPPDVRGWPVVFVGALGLTVNGVSAWVLHRQSEGDLNVRAALAHVLGDALGSCAAIAAGLIVALTGETRADPALSLAVALLLLWSARRLVLETAHILMEGTPEGIDPREMEQVIASVPGVASVHDLHVWSIAAGEPAVSVHVELAPGAAPGEMVARAVCDALEHHFHVHHSTVQPEPPATPIVPLGRK